MLPEREGRALDPGGLATTTDLESRSASAVTDPGLPSASAVAPSTSVAAPSVSAVGTREPSEAIARKPDDVPGVTRDLEPDDDDDGVSPDGDGVSNHVVWLSAAFSFALAGSVLGMWLTGSTTGRVSAIALLVFGVPMIVSALRERAERDRERAAAQRNRGKNRSSRRTKVYVAGATDRETPGHGRAG